MQGAVTLGVEATDETVIAGQSTSWWKMSQFKFSNRDSADSPGLRSHTILQQGRPAVDSIKVKR